MSDVDEKERGSEPLPSIEEEEEAPDCEKEDAKREKPVEAVHEDHCADESKEQDQSAANILERQEDEPPRSDASPGAEEVRKPPDLTLDHDKEKDGSAAVKSEEEDACPDSGARPGIPEERKPADLEKDDSKESVVSDKDRTELESANSSKTEDVSKPAHFEKEEQEKTADVPQFEDSTEDERRKKDKAASPDHESQQIDATGPVEETKTEEVLPHDQASHDEFDGQVQVVLEFQYLAEAVAFLAFKKTADELEKAAKKLADVLLGPGWQTDRKKRRELPWFVKETLGKASKSLESYLGVFGVNVLLLWLAKKCTDENYATHDDDEEQRAVMVCQSINAGLKKMQLFNVWLTNRQALPPKDIVDELHEYRSVLMTLGCEKSLQAVEDAAARLTEELETVKLSRGASEKKDDVRVEASIVEMAVVFKAFHHVEEYVYEFCRDFDPDISQSFAALLKDTERENMDDLSAKLSFIQAQRKFSKIATQLAEMSVPLNSLSQHLVQELKPPGHGKTGRKAIFVFWDSFKRLRELLRWKAGEQEREILYISKLLNRFLREGFAKTTEPVKVCIPSQLEPVYPRKRHHWISSERETIVGREHESSQICGLLKDRAGKVLITASSGMGKSSLAREAAFQLRTAWPSQFVIDMSTPLSEAASLAEHAAFHTFKEMFTGLDNVRTTASVVSRMFNSFLEQGEFRILLILENCDSLERPKYLDPAYREDVSIIIVSRTEEQPWLRRQEELIDLRIELKSFILEEDEEYYEKLKEKGVYVPEEIQDLRSFILWVTNGFPLAVQFARKLFLDFPMECMHTLQYFVWPWDQSDLSDQCRESCLALTSLGNASAVSSFVLFALDLIEEQTGLQHLVYRIALLAWPTVPVLPSLLNVAVDVSPADFDEIVQKLDKLGKYGVILQEQDEEGRRPCLRMHALVSEVILSKILALPFAERYKLLAQCVESFCLHLGGIVGPTELNIFVRESIACSAVNLEGSGFFERFCEKEVSHSQVANCHRVFALHGSLNYSIGNFFGAASEESSFVVSPENACKFYTNGLAIISYLRMVGEQQNSFWNIVQDYLYVLVDLPEGALATRLNELLTFSLTGGIREDSVLLNQEEAAYMALRFADAAIRTKDLEWTAVYLGCAEDLTKDMHLRLQLIQQQSVFYIRLKLFDKLRKKLHTYMNETNSFFASDYPIRGTCLRYLGEVCLHQGEKEQAKQCFLESVQKLEQFKRNPAAEKDVLDSLLFLGGVDLLEESKPQVSRGYLKKALAIARERSDKPGGRDSRNYSYALIQMAELEDALGNSQKANELRESIPPEFAALIEPKEVLTEPESTSSSSSSSPMKTPEKGKKKKKRKKKKSQTSSEEDDGDSHSSQ